VNRTLVRLLALAMILILTGCQGAPPPAPAGQSQLARGEYLVNVLGCHDCHTPKIMGEKGPVPDMSRRLSGHPEGSNLPAPPQLPEGPWAVTCTWDLTAWSGPWGITYATNLTPDEDTGMGIWTEEMFLKAIRTGKHMSEGRPILPPMPIEDFRHLTDEDLEAVFAFLRSLPAVKNAVPEAVILPPPGAPAAEGDAPAKPTGS